MPVGTRPDAELVISAWISSIPNFTADFVDYQLPWDLNVPVDNGYVQVTVIGGVPEQNAAFFHTTAQVDCWVNSPSMDRIYRLQASDLIKQIQLACYDRHAAERAVSPVETISEGQSIAYPPAHVYTATGLTEPHRIGPDKDNPLYEGYSADFSFTWAWSISTP